MSSNANLSAVPTSYSDGLSKREFFALIFGAACIISNKYSVTNCIDTGVELADYLLAKLEED